MSDRKDQAAVIIHSAATVGATIAGVMAQIAWFGADIPLLATVTITMIIVLGKLFGHTLQRAAVVAVVGEIFAVMVGFTLAKGLLGLMPILGNVANAAVAFGVTEAIGWAAYLAFEKGLDISKVTPEQWKELLKDAKKVEKPNVNEMLQKMSPEDRAYYQSLQDKLKDKNLSDSEREKILLEMAQFTKNYKSRK